MRLGLNPVWRETFKFRLDVPDLAILEFKVPTLPAYISQPRYDTCNCFFTGNQGRHRYRTYRCAMS